MSCCPIHGAPAPAAADQKSLEDLEDASNELMLSDEESIRYGFGECFVHISKDSAEEKVQGLTDKTQEEVQVAGKELEEIRGKMKVLKAQLYGKFGNSINLEDD